MFDHASINRAYKLVWSDRLNTYVVAAETAKGRGQRAVRGVAATLITALSLAGLAQAQSAAPPAATQLPSGGRVVAGQASIGQSGARLDINQNSNRAAIDWQSFNVGSGAQVNFNQPGAQSVTLNRVLDTQPSQIYGRISANGQVFLTNPNGAYFAPTASVDVGGLVATTHRMSVADFMAGQSTFERNGATGAVVNQGRLTSALGGYIALLAPEVRNEGYIVAQAGAVALAAGESITLNFSGMHTLTGITVTPSQIKALVENKHAVLAPGGLIILSAQAADRLQGGVVNNSGTLEAQGIAQRGGRIVLEASHTLTQSPTGRIDASGVSGGGILLKSDRNIDVQGSVHAVASSGSGGTITVAASQAVMLKAALDVSGIDSGGFIHLQALQAGPGLPAPDVPVPATPSAVMLANGAQLRAGSSRGRGGAVTLEGDYIRLAENTLIDARGAAGGGHVLVGGDWQGTGSMRQATQVIMDRGALIDVSATRTGDGGKAVLWSDIRNRDGATMFNGRINATGAGAGKGGLVETSGHKLSVRGTVHAGKGGQWLLDPYDVVIDNAPGNNIDAGFTATGTPAVVDANAIAAALSAGSDVTVTTGNGGTQAGNITLNSHIQPGAMANDATLTLKAERSIVMNAGTSIDATQFGNANKLHVVLWANAAGNGRGSIEMGSNTAIRSNGGNIVLGGGSNIYSGYAVGAGSGDSGRGIWLKEAALLDAGGGNISLRGMGQDGGEGVFLGNPGVGGTLLTTSGAGMIMVDGRGTTDNTGVAGMPANATTGITLANDVRMQTDAGFIYLNGSGGYAVSAGTDNSGIVIGSGTRLLSASGPILLVGSAGAGASTVASGIRFTSGRNHIGHDDGGHLGSSSSSIVISADTLRNDSATTNIRTTGALTIQPANTSFENTFTWSGNLSSDNFVGSGSISGLVIHDFQNLTGLTLGKAGNTAGITLASPLTLNGSLNLIGGDIQVNRSLTLNSQVLTVTNSGVFTVADGRDIYAAGGFNQDGFGASNLGGDIRTNNAPLRFAGTINIGDQVRLHSDGGDIALGGSVTGAAGGSSRLRLESDGGNIGLNGEISNLQRLTLRSSGTTTQTAPIRVADLLLDGSGGNYVLTHGDNQINTLAANVAGGSVAVNNGAPLAIGTVDGVSGVRASGGTLQIETGAGHGLSVNRPIVGAAPALLAGGDLILNAPVTATAGDLLFSSGAAFVNNAGANALVTPGRWLVYSQSPAANNFGGLVSGNTGLFGKNLLSDGPAAVAADGYTGNRYLFATSENITLTTLSANSTYGEAPPSLTTRYNVSTPSTYGGAILAPTLSGSPLLGSAGASATAGAGTYAINADVSGMRVDAPGYNIVAANTGLLTIVPRTVSVGGTRVYDATTAIAAGALTLGNIVNGDTVALSGSGVLSGKTVGSQNLRSLGTLALSNANYTLIGVTATVNITPAALSVGGVTAQNKLYDATMVASLSGTPGVTPLGADRVSVGGSAVAVFGDYAVGNNKPVTVSGYTLSGADAANYTVQQPGGLTAHILALPPANVGSSGGSGSSSGSAASSGSGDTGNSTTQPPVVVLSSIVKPLPSADVVHAPAWPPLPSTDMASNHAELRATTGGTLDVTALTSGAQEADEQRRRAQYTTAEGGVVAVKRP